jgi:hypothetical protein
MKVEYADAVVRTKQRTDINPDQYAPVLDQEMARIRGSATAEFAAKYPNFVADFKAKTAQFGVTEAVNARYEGLRRKTEQSQAAAALNLQLLANRLAETDNSDLQAETLKDANTIFTTMSQTGMWSGEQTASAVKEFYGSVEEARARKLFQDPSKRLDVIQTLRQGQGSHMSVLKRMDLADKLISKYDADIKEAERQQTKLMLEAKEQAQSDIMASALRPDKNVPQLLARLEDARVALGLKDTEVHRLNDVIVKPSSDAPSDPDVRARFISNIYMPRPSVTMASLEAAYDNYRANRPGLNAHDYLDLRSKLLTRLDHNEAVARADRSEARSVNNLRHNQAEQLLLTALGIPERAIIAQLEPKKALMIADMLSELTDRSNAFSGREDPLVAVKDIIPRGQNRIIEDSKILRDNWNAQLKNKYQSMAPDIDKAAAEMERDRRLGFGPNKPFASQEDYDNQRRILLELAKLQRERIRLELEKGVRATTRQIPPATPPTEAPSPWPEPSQEKYAPEFRRPTTTGR